jgi:hypothetical protein
MGFVAAENEASGRRAKKEGFWNYFTDPLTPLMSSDTTGRLPMVHNIACKANVADRDCHALAADICHTDGSLNEQY